MWPSESRIWREHVSQPGMTEIATAQTKQHECCMSSSGFFIAWVGENLYRLVVISSSCRDTYKKLDLDKSYQSLIELLWYSQLPCFDVANVTTKNNEDFGISTP